MIKKDTLHKIIINSQIEPISHFYNSFLNIKKLDFLYKNFLKKTKIVNLYKKKLSKNKYKKDLV